MEKLNQACVWRELGYGSFGSVLEGRSWSGGSEYRYSFNGEQINLNVLNLSPMENETIKCYCSNFIFPIGRTITVITGWEYQETLYCERFTFLEKMNHGFLSRNLRTTISKEDYKIFKGLNLIEKFMENEGYNISRSDSYVLFWGQVNQSSLDLTQQLNHITFEDYDVYQCLIYLKEKKNDIFLYLKKHTLQNKLKLLIEIIEGINPTFSAIE